MKRKLIVLMLLLNSLSFANELTKNSKIQQKIVISSIIFKDKELSKNDFAKLSKNFNLDSSSLSGIVQYLINCRKYKDDATIKKMLYVIPQRLASIHDTFYKGHNSNIQFKLMLLFLEQLKKYPKDTKLLWGASQICENLDKGLTINLLEQGKKYSTKKQNWAKKLGNIYELTNNEAESYKNYKLAFEFSNKNDQKLIVGDLAYAALKLKKFTEAEKYALLCLDFASKQEDRYWNKNNLIFSGNDILGLIAFEKGNFNLACKHLIISGNTNGSAQLSSFGPDMTLANKLLRIGKKRAVISFLELCSKYWEKKLCYKWIKEIKDGKIPILNPYNILN